MIIKKKCIITGKINELDLPVTQTQINNWRSGMLIQDAMPNLNTFQREFIMTGITNDTWKKHLNETKEIVNEILNPERND